MSAVRIITEVRPEYPPDRRRSALSPAGCHRVSADATQPGLPGRGRPRGRPGVTSEKPAQREAGRDKPAELRRALLTGLIRVLRPAGPGHRRSRAHLQPPCHRPPRRAGPPGKHHVPAAPSAPAMLTLVTQDHTTTGMVCASAGIAMARHAGRGCRFGHVAPLGPRPDRLSALGVDGGGQPVEEEGFGSGQPHREEQGDSAGAGWGYLASADCSQTSSLRWWASTASPAHRTASAAVIQASTSPSCKTNFTSTLSRPAPRPRHPPAGCICHPPGPGHQYRPPALRCRMTIPRDPTAHSDYPQTEPNWTGTRAP